MILKCIIKFEIIITKQHFIETTGSRLDYQIDLSERLKL